VNTPLTLFSSLPTPDKTALFFCARVMFVGDALAATKFGSAASIAASISSVRVGGGARLNFAMWCRTSIASASLPRLSKNLGDS
jgi:hypothetical protein